MYRSDFSGMIDNIDLAIKLLYDVKERISEREGLIQFNESSIIRLDDIFEFKYIPSAETSLSELKLIRKLLSETAIELNKGRHYTGEEHENN